MIDWHSHILPGLDDGPADIEQSLVMAKFLATAGFTTVHCTPHLMRGCYEADNEEVRLGVADLQDRLNSSGIPLVLLAGREYCLDEFLLTALEDPLPLGDSRLILVEIPLHITIDMVRRILYSVVRSGFTPVIAHPERCILLAPPTDRIGSGGIWGAIGSLLGGNRRTSQIDSPADPTGNHLLDYLRELGCFFQGNLGSFTGYYGRQVKFAAEALRAMGVYDRYGSDLHAPEQARMILGPTLPR